MKRLMVNKMGKIYGGDSRTGNKHKVEDFIVFMVCLMHVGIIVVSETLEIALHKAILLIPVSIFVMVTCWEINEYLYKNTPKWVAKQREEGNKRLKDFGVKTTILNKGDD